MTKRAGRRGVSRVFAGFVVGVVTGLTIAAVAALFITRAPVPFVNKVLRPGERAAEPKAGAELPDPNRPLQRKRADAAPEGAPAATPAPAEGAPATPGVLDRLFGGSPASPTAPPAAPAEGASRSGEIGRAGEGSRAPATPAEAAARPGAAEERSSFFLQAGAFRSPDDADSMKARLALIGLEARVSAVEVNGQTLHRVRVGPFAQMDDVNKVRTRLAENGIEASVMRQK